MLSVPVFACSVSASSPVFGLTNKGWWGAWQPAGAMVASSFYSSADGVPSSICVYVGNPTGYVDTVKGAIYEDSSQRLVAVSEAKTVPAWQDGWMTLNVESAEYVSSGWSYSIVVWFEGVGCYLYYSSGAFGQSWYANEAFTGSFPSGPYSSFPSYGLENTAYSIYATMGSTTTTVSPRSVWNDGFESPETVFQRWSAAYVAAGSTLTISSSHVYTGTYSLHSTATTNLGPAYLQLNIASTNSLYAGANVYFTSFGNPETFTRLLKLTGNAQDNSVACVAVVNDHGIMRWGLHWRDGANVLRYEASDWIVHPYTWYFVEVKGVVSGTAGEARLYVNGIEMITKTGLDNYQIGSIYQIRCGIQSDLISGSVDVYIDNVVVDSSYING